MGTLKKPLYKRILAGIIALVLIGVLFSITNSFTGNPISAHSAEKRMEKYIKQKYPNLEITTSKTNYNFKFSEYTLVAKDNNSKDTFFTVHARGRKHIYDDYKWQVIDGGNTIDRLGKEMTAEITPLLKALFGDEIQGRCFADLMRKDEEMLQKPPLETPFSKNLKLPATLFIDFKVHKPTLHDIADKIIRTNNMMIKNGYIVTEFVFEAIDKKTNKGYQTSVNIKYVDEKLADTLKSVFEDKNSTLQDIDVWEVK